jgi:hypothetical protein
MIFMAPAYKWDDGMDARTVLSQAAPKGLYPGSLRREPFIMDSVTGR